MAQTAKQIFLDSILKKGEIYAGIILGKNGDPDHHLILLPGESKDMPFEKAKEWAEKQGGELPTRREQSLLFANLREEFNPVWYWSCEQRASASSYAWSQTFDYGDQDDGYKDGLLRARAVRRSVI